VLDGLKVVFEALLALHIKSRPAPTLNLPVIGTVLWLTVNNGAQITDQFC